MNPKNETWAPGEIHYYSDFKKKADPGCEPKSRGLGGWLSRNKPLALSLGNLILLVPMVLILYPFLISQIDKAKTAVVGNLEIHTQLFTTETELLVKLKPRFIGDSPESGTLVTKAAYGAEIRTYSLFLERPTEKTITLKFPVLPPDTILDLEAFWGGKSVKWSLSPE